MNHGPAFQALWTRLRTEVRQLQDRGYYGDGMSSCTSTFPASECFCRLGYWSSGTRLRDSARVGGEGVEDGNFPEYIVRYCGISFLTSLTHSIGCVVWRGSITQTTHGNSPPSGSTGQTT